MVQSAARKASLKKALKASVEKRARVTEARRSSMAALIEEKWELREISANHLMATFKISRSTLDRDMEELTKQALLPRSFKLKTRKQIDAERSKVNREEKIRNYIGQGFDNQKISAMLRISVRRVKRLIDGMKARGDRRLETAIEYTRKQKKLKIFRERDTWTPAQKLTNADEIKALEEELGESFEERNFENMVIYYGDLMEDIHVHWNPYFSNAVRAKLLRMGVVVKTPHKPIVMSERARLTLMKYRAGELKPMVFAGIGDEEDEPLTRAAEG